MKDISRNVTLLCGICGNDQFSTLDEKIEDLKEAPDTTEVRCSDCGKIYTKAELIEENQEVINANVEDMQEEVIEEFDKELAKVFKKWR